MIELLYLGGDSAMVIGEALRQFVPLAYLAMALYLGLEASPRKVWNWIYIMSFGVFGIASYMILNEPAYSWIPIWVTNDIWVTIVLFCILILGVLLFVAAIELQGLDSPAVALQNLYEWLCRRIFRK